MSGMYDRFKRFSAQKGMYMSECAKEIGIMPSTISNWKRRDAVPNGDLVVKIADYFEITCDKVLGHTPVNQDAQGYVISDEELEIINRYNDLNLNEQNMIRRMLNLKEKETSKSSEVV